jgi:hypothetical protein
MHSTTTPVHRMMLGFPAPSNGFRNVDVLEFMRGVVRRREPHFALAEDALRKGPQAVRKMITSFTFVSPETLVLRVREVLGDNPDPEGMYELLQSITQNVHLYEERTVNIIEETNELRMKLRKRALSSKTMDLCLKNLQADVEFEKRWAHKIKKIKP